MTEFRVRHAALVPRAPRLRLAAAALILGAAFAGAASLYSHKFVALDCGSYRFCGHPDIRVVRPGWVDPAVLALCALGVAGAVGLLAARVRVATAAVILGAAFGGAAVVYAHYRYAFLRCHMEPSGFNHLPVPLPTFSCVPRITYYRAGWVSPTALGIVLVGVALAAGVLVTARWSRLAATRPD
jgi:hypothetical protein